MSRPSIPRNALCPCGSGKKYSACCLTKLSEQSDDRENQNLPSRPAAVLIDQSVLDESELSDAAYGEEFPLSLAGEEYPPFEQVEHHFVMAMHEAGIDPAMIYAFEKTGHIVSEDNRHLLSPEDIVAWEQAVLEYRHQQTQQDQCADYPIGTVALYGPDDTITTKIAVSVLSNPDADPIMRRWFGSDVRNNEKAQIEMLEFLREHGVTQVVATDINIGCPHEEGEDFPFGGDCPFCPFWKGKQGSCADL